MARRLVVMESEWWPNYSHTIRTAFEFLSHDISDRVDGFRYERFVGRESFFETLEHAVTRRDARFIYIACHGSSEALHCPNGSKISIKELEAALERINRGTRLDGLFLGSCLVGREETGRALLNSDIAPPQRLKWLAGYSRRVDWFDATLLDLLFLRTLINIGDDTSPLKRVQGAVQNVVNQMPGLSHESGFRVFVRQKRTGNIINIVTSDYEDFETEY